VFVAAFLFLLGIETWKWAKRVYFRRQTVKMGDTPDDLEKKAFGEYLPTSESESQQS